MEASPATTAENWVGGGQNEDAAGPGDPIARRGCVRETNAEVEEWV